MFTFGDILAYIGVLLAVGVSAWAFMIASALLFPEKTGQAGVFVKMSFGRTFFSGLLMIILLMIPVVILARIPGLNLFAYWMISMIACVASFGGSGIVQLIRERILEEHPEMPRFQALVKSSALLSAVVMSPLVGWFFLAPMFLILGFGAGVRAIRFKQP